MISSIIQTLITIPHYPEDFYNGNILTLVACRIATLVSIAVIIKAYIFR